MNKREYKQVKINKKGYKRLLNNHPWVFIDDIYDDNSINNGEIVDVISEKNKYLGTGFYNNNSKIVVRIISKNINDKFDYDFFKRRIRYAIDYRYNVMDNLDNIRVIFGESDFLPGLTVDKYNDILVCEVLSLGIDNIKDMIYKILIEVFMEYNIKINGIYERNESKIRELEGLKCYKGWYYNPNNLNTNTIINENDIKYYVDFENGQKTGFFLDQKYNKLLVRRISKNKNVLDCFCHTGGFAMNAYLGNAKKVVALDISNKAINDAKNNFKLNNMDIETINMDAFTYLTNNKNKYDLIILDPPAFTKSKNKIKNALDGYREINYLGMKNLKRGGYLVTASCTHFVNHDMLLEIIKEASIKANVQLKLVSFTGPSYDHPELIFVPETNYLKFFIFQIN